MLKEWKAHNAVVCAFVFCERGAAQLGLLVVGAVNSRRIEDFVDAGKS